MYDRFHFTDAYITDTVYRRPLSEFAPHSAVSPDNPDTAADIILASADTGTALSPATDSDTGSSENKKEAVTDTSGDTPSSETSDTETKDKSTEPHSASDSENTDSETVAGTAEPENTEENTDAQETAAETDTETESESETETVSETTTESETTSEAGTETETGTEPETESIADIPYEELPADTLAEPVLTTEVLTVLQSMDSGIQTLNTGLSALFFILLFHMLANYGRRIVRRIFPDDKPSQ